MHTGRRQRWRPQQLLLLPTGASARHGAVVLKTFVAGGGREQRRGKTPAETLAAVVGEANVAASPVPLGIANEGGLVRRLAATARPEGERASRRPRWVDLLRVVSGT